MAASPALVQPRVVGLPWGLWQTRRQGLSGRSSIHHPELGTECCEPGSHEVASIESIPAILARIV